MRKIVSGIDISEESEERILSFLKSCFRYKQMVEKKAPETLIVLEKSIFKDRLEKLSPEEVFCAILSWEGYYEKRIVTNEVEDEKMIRDINQRLLSLN
jgi:hypothetical protein